MGKGIKGVAGFSLLLGALLMCGAPHEASAEVRVGINVNLGPPPIVVAEPPAVVLVPRSQVYFVPEVDIDVFFHNGYWWSPRGDGWYRSKAYNGPWRLVERRQVPAAVVRVPGDFRKVYVKEKPIPYGQWKKSHKHHKDKEHRGKRDHDDRGGKHRDRGDDHHDHDDDHGRGEGRGHGHGR